MTKSKIAPKPVVSRRKNWRLKKKLIWEIVDKPFEQIWEAKEFKIYWVEGRGGEDGGDAYLLNYNTREIEYFKTLGRAKKVAELIYAG